MEISKKAVQKSKQNSVSSNLGSEKDKHQTRLNKLTDNFDYFQNRAKLNLKNENINLITLSGISQNSIKTLTAVLNR